MTIDRISIVSRTHSMIDFSSTVSYILTEEFRGSSWEHKGCSSYFSDIKEANVTPNSGSKYF